jgi:hypothetical protein
MAAVLIGPHHQNNNNTIHLWFFAICKFLNGVFAEPATGGYVHAEFEMILMTPGISSG